MPHPKVKIADDSGNTVAVDTTGASNALKVALVAGASIDIGDVEILGHSTILSYQNNTVGTSAEIINQGTGAGGSGIANSPLACKHIDIMAAVANTGIIYVGGSGVTTATGIALYAGDVYSVDIENTSLLYALPTVDNEDINVVFYN